MGPDTSDKVEGGSGAQRLQGSVERVTFHNPENGFCVLGVKVKDRREPVTVVGNAPSVSPGELLECEGAWENDRRHGLQFKAQKLTIIPPNTLDGIEKYLGSGMVRGIGRHFARKLVRAFGEEVFDVIERDPDRLLKLDGIGPKRKDQVTRAWAEQKAVRNIMVFLQSHGLGTARAVRIYKTYGAQAVDQVRENPYCLALDIQGIGFKTADDIAHRIGIPRDAQVRAQAGVRHLLQEFAAEGHCAVTRERLEEAASSLLEMPVSAIATAIDSDLEAGHLVCEEIGDQPALYLAQIYRAETGVAQQLKRLQAGKPVWGRIDAGTAIPWVEQRTGFTLSDSQRDAVATAIDGKVTVITGGPGVGKTTIINSILRILRAKNAETVLCAPTGRAAKRLAESTGLESSTIHRLLEFDPGIMGFKRNEANPLHVDLLVVDEASMVDVVLMNRLLCAIPTRAAVLLVGDVDQLPSVGPGSVLADMIESGALATVRLKEIFRQASTSRIIVNAHLINNGELPEKPEQGNPDSDFFFIAAETPEAIHDKLLYLVNERIPKRFGFHPIDEIQVLTPMNRGGLGTRALNLDLQRLLNPDARPSIERFGWTYAPGDKVIQTVNNYDKDVFNGDIGRIARIDQEEAMVFVDFEGRRVEYGLNELDEVSLAYATTVHKAQGSEYPVVVIPFSTQHYAMLERNLLYTAVTRGKNLVVIVGQIKAIAMAVKRVGGRKRMTNLRERLRA